MTTTEYVPFANAGEKVQLPDVDVAVNVQVTGDPELGVAVTVTKAPVVKDVRSKVGVLSAVTLSEFEEPVSDAP